METEAPENHTKTGGNWFSDGAEKKGAKGAEKSLIPLY